MSLFVYSIVEVASSEVEVILKNVFDA